MMKSNKETPIYYGNARLGICEDEPGRVTMAVDVCIVLIMSWIFVCIIFALEKM